VSGQERVIKPDPRIYRILCERYALSPAQCVFIDDNAKNVAGAEAIGMRAVLYESPPQLRQALRTLGFAL
jgi:2-haloacid dehalogenase